MDRVGGSKVEADFTQGRSVGPAQFHVEAVVVERAQNRGHSCLHIHTLDELQQPYAQSLVPAPGIERHETGRLPCGINDHLETEGMSQFGMLFPDFDLVEPLFACNAFRDDAAGPAPVVESHNLRDIFACGFAQCEWLRLALFRFGDQRNGGSASIFQFESIFIAELAIEVGDAGNGLDKISLGLAAFVDHLEESTNESTVAIRWVGSNHLWTANTEGDA